MEILFLASGCHIRVMSRPFADLSLLYSEGSQLANGHAKGSHVGGLLCKTISVALTKDTRYKIWQVARAQLTSKPIETQQIASERIEGSFLFL